MTAHEKKHCPLCKTELPDYASYVVGTVSLTLCCPDCGASIVISKPDFEPRVVSEPQVEQGE